MSVWMRIAGGIGIASILGMLVITWIPDPGSAQFLVTAAWAAAEPRDYVKVLAMLLLLTGWTANDGFAILEGGALALLITRLPACIWWALPSSDICAALPYVYTAMSCWIAFFLVRHGDRFVYAAVFILVMLSFFVPALGPAVMRRYGRVFSVRRASAPPPGDSK